MVAFAWVVIIAGLVVGFGNRADEKRENPSAKGMTRVQKWSFGAVAVAAVYALVIAPSLDTDTSTPATSVEDRSGPCTYKVTADFEEEWNNSVGHDWKFYATVNGKTISNSGVEITCDVGDRVDLYTQCVEQDTYPDIGEDNSYIIIEKDDLWNPFTVYCDVTVTEDRGRYAGNTAEIAVTFTFEPVE
mgnify:FL=1